jgi:uncharacterized protein YqjF (DUF2071 family)
MRHVEDGDELSYDTCRRGASAPCGRAPGHRRHGDRARSYLRVRRGDPIPEPTSLDHFLTPRWGLHSRWYGISAYLPIRHEPWPWQHCEVLELDDTLIQAAGLRAPAEAPHVLYSGGVEVHLGAPSRLGEPSRRLPR